MEQRTGGCLCGKVRYQVVGKQVVSRLCWCRDCQHISSNGTVNAIFPTEAIHITGETAVFQSTAESGNQVRRRFCAACGSHLFADNTGRAGLTVVRVGTLDDPSTVSPTANIWVASAPTWACMDSALQHFHAQPTQLKVPPGVA